MVCCLKRGSTEQLSILSPAWGSQVCALSTRSHSPTQSDPLNPRCEGCWLLLLATGPDNPAWSRVGMGSQAGLGERLEGLFL